MMNTAVIPEHVSMYLSRTALLIRDGQVDVSEAEGFLLDNVYRELDGLEVDVIKEKRPSKCFETICNVSTQLHLRGFLHRICMTLGSNDEPYAELCCNPYASHALETLFTRMANAPTRPEDEAPARDSQGVKIEPMGILAQQWMRRMGSDLIGMASNASASHVLRSMILLFSGCRWASKHLQTAFKLSGAGVIRRDDPPTPWMHELFEQVVGNFVTALETSREEAMRFGCMAPSSATLQLLLAVCAAASRDGWRDRLVRALTGLPSDPKANWEAVEGSLAEDLSRDRVGSRLLEAVVERSSLVDFHRLWTGLLEPRARALAMDGAGNWVLSAALDRTKLEGLDAGKAVENICTPNLSGLMKNQRLGVVVRVVKAASETGSGPEDEEASRRRRRVLALLAYSDARTPLLETLLGTVEEGGSGASRPLVDLAGALHSLGEEGRAVLDVWWDGLDEEQVRLACSCRSWSSVSEAMLHGHTSPKSKFKFIRKMRINWLLMCSDKYAHHVILTALSTLEGMGQGNMAEALRLEMKQNRDSLARNEWGTKLLKRLAAEGDERRIEDPLGEKKRREAVSMASIFNETGKRDRLDDVQGAPETTKREKKEKKSKKKSKHEDEKDDGPKLSRKNKKKEKKRLRRGRIETLFLFFLSLLLNHISHF